MSKVEELKEKFLKLHTEHDRFSYVVTKEQMDDLITLAREECNQWIPVGERLPKDGEEVDIIADGLIVTGKLKEFFF